MKKGSRLADIVETAAIPGTQYLIGPAGFRTRLAPLENAADYKAYEYDAAGNRTSLRKRDGSVLTYTYDALNRVTLKSVPERPTGPQALTAAQTRDVYYAYDLRNQQLSARFDSATGEGVTNSYDGFGRPKTSSINLGGTTRTLTHGYDAAGNRNALPGRTPSPSASITTRSAGPPTCPARPISAMATTASPTGSAAPTGS